MRSSRFLLPILLSVCAWSASAQEIFNFGRQAVVSPELTEETITFRLVANYATEVGIQASWAGYGVQPMTKGERGVWSITMPRPASELYTYNFVVDGISTLDPSNTFVQRDGTRYMSAVLVDGGYADLYKEATHKGNLEHVWYYSAENDMERRMYVYTPYGYDAKGKKKYPVLYLLHGGGGDEDAWSTLGRTCQILDNLIEQGKAVPMLVVMPNGNPNQYAASTLQIPVKQDVRQYASGFDNYSSLVADILPYVESHYNVIKNRTGRAVAGLSMGGGQSFYIGLRNIDVFANIGIFSSGLLGGSGAGQAAFDPEAQMPGLISNPAKYNKLDLFYISCGEQDNRIGGTKEFVDQLNALGYKNVFYETYPDRNQAQWQGLNRSAAADVCGELHVVPQESGNRAAYWVSLELKDRRLSFCSADTGRVGFGLRRYTDSVMTAARRIKDLTPSNYYVVNIDARQAGLGTATCGPGVSERFRISGDSVQQFRLAMVPSMLADSVNLWRYCGYYFDTPPEMKKNMPQGHPNHIESVTVKTYGDSTQPADQPNTTYSNGFPKTLHDGRLGIAGNYSDGWTGFSGRDSIDFNIVLDEPLTLDRISAGFCHSPADWVVRPLRVEIQWSQDGKRYTPWQPLEPVRPIVNEGKESRRLMLRRTFAPRQGLFHPAEARGVRYVRLRVHCQPTLPLWHPYSGEPAWLMVDEITIQ